MANRLRSTLLYGLAQVNAFFKRNRQAIAAYREAIAADPGNPAPWRSIGFLEAQQGRPEDAIAAFTQALVIAPADAVTRFNLAFVLHQTGRHDAAITEFQRTVEETPNNDRAWYGLGLCLADVGRLEQAVDALRQAAKLQYFNPHAGHHLALALHKLGRADRDAGRRLACPLLVLWGAQGVIQQCFDPLAEWRRVAEDVRGCSLQCGHYIPEEAPEALLAEVLPFLSSPVSTPE